jgi:chemotaxis protein methyltransferase CheR
MMLSDATFKRYSVWMEQNTGVSLPPSKKTLVQQRLHKRLVARNVDSLEVYYRLLTAPEEEAERRIAIDLLTTHETYFFREPKHFDWLQALLRRWPPKQPLRVWCAASSTGEETWSLAMMLADALGIDGDWQLLGSDISDIAIDKARRAHYSMQRIEGIPAPYLRRFCLKGTGPHQGTMLIQRELRLRAEFALINLDKPLPAIGPFDVVFLRNVMIYFKNETKVAVVERVLSRMNKDGWLVVSHSESLHGMQLPIKLEAPGVYRKMP